MERQPFTLTIDQGHWSVRYRHPKTKKRLSAKRVCVLADMLDMDNPDRIKGRKAEFLAFDICEKALKMGIIFRHDGDMLAIEYCRHYWDYDDPEGYIALKNRRHEDGEAIGRDYAKSMLWNFNRHIAKYLDGMYASEVTTDLMEDIQKAVLLARNPKTGRFYCNSTAKQIMLSIRLPMKEAHRRRIVRENPSEYLEPICVSSMVRRGVPNWHQVRDVLTWVADNSHKVYHLAISLAVMCGLRQGEIRALSIDDIDTDVLGDTAILRISKSFSDSGKIKCTKGKRERLVPCPMWLAREVKRYAMSCKYPTMFALWCPRNHVTSIKGTAMLAELRKALCHVGMPVDEQKARKIDFHSLRHFYVTTLRGQIPADTFEYIVGHRSASTTDLYTHMEGQLMTYGHTITDAFARLID